MKTAFSPPLKQTLPLLFARKHLKKWWPALLIFCIGLCFAFREQGPARSSRHHVTGVIDSSEFVILQDSLSKFSGYRSFINTKIRLSAFMYYFNGASNGNYTKGLRVYFGQTDDGDIFFLLSVGGPGSDNPEGGYYPLLDTSITAISLDDTITGKQAQDYIDRYQSNVKIVAPAGRTPRIARYYSWTDLLHLISDNIPYFNTAQVDSLARYSIVLKHGYVGNNLCGPLYRRYKPEYPGLDSADLTGHTTVFYLRDDEKNTSLARNQTDISILSYYRQYLEIGEPCPPNCPAVSH